MPVGAGVRSRVLGTMFIGAAIVAHDHVHAQALRGRVLATDSVTVIATAEVSVFRSDKLEERALTFVAGPSGFLAALPSGGTYWIEATNLGYATTRTRTFSVRQTDTLVIDILLSTQPLRIEPLIVRGYASSPEPHFMKDMRQRMSRGLGKYLLREDMLKRLDTPFGDMIRETGFYVGTTKYGDPFLQTKRSSDSRYTGSLNDLPDRDAQYLRLMGCMPLVYVDGIKWQLVSSGVRPIPQWDLIESLFSLKPSDIEAIELYRGAAEVPPIWSGSDSLCGVVAVWTRRAGR
jgi:hypothetical protein